MGSKFGLFATTSVMALLAISGCAQWSDRSVARDARFDTDTPSLNQQVCDAAWEACDTPRVALLKAPRNVVYTTRAGVTPDAQLEDLETDAQGSTPQDARIAPESADNKE